MIVLVAGARPNFMKIAPLCYAFKERGITPLFCHTGQHKDYMMSQVFINDLGLPAPDFYGVSNSPGGVKLAIIVGDVDSSRDAAEYYFKRNIPIAHIEAGLRSFDLDMPEERNRIFIDSISDYLFVTESSGVVNLEVENVKGKIYLVGNVMIDTLTERFEPFILLTLHRPSNVDIRLYNILDMMDSIGIEVVYPVHPRVNIKKKYKNIRFIEPLGYINFIQMLKNSYLVVTDSGGVQEECAYLGKRCITLRKNTERPITLEYGNRLAYDLIDAKKIIESFNIPLWDGKAAERIVNILIKEL